MDDDEVVWILKKIERGIQSLSMLIAFVALAYSGFFEWTSGLLKIGLVMMLTWII